MARRSLASGRRLGLAAALLLPACGGSAPAPPASDEGQRPPTPGSSAATGTYERSFVFASEDGDSVFLVPWLTEAVQWPDTVARRATGWLARGGTWEQFFDERWATQSTRTPARVLPFGALTFVVREGDAIDGILFEEGPRSLELVLGDVTASWVGSRGETVELSEGVAYLLDQRVDGAVLDMTRATARQGEAPGGDWAFLVSGDSARFVLSAQSEHGGENEPTYQGWADLGDATLQWPEIRVDWWDRQAFPPARRDVPVAWRVWTSDGLLEGELSTVSSEIRAGNGPGPLLPVRALYQVAGQLSTVAGRFDVHGLLVHERR